MLFKTSLFAASLNLIVWLKSNLNEAIYLSMSGFDIKLHVELNSYSEKEKFAPKHNSNVTYTDAVKFIYDFK